MRGLFLVAALAALVGCSTPYKGAKIVEGTDITVAIDLPVNESPLEFKLLNYLSGFRLAVADNAMLNVKYTATIDNTYFGIIKHGETKSIDAKVVPCENTTTNCTCNK